MYLVNTRLDICYAISALSQFMNELRYIHLVVAKHILKYLRGTIGFGLKYSYNGELNLQGFTDSDWAGSAVISRCSRKQSSVALSTTKAKYMAACMAV